MVDLICVGLAVLGLESALPPCAREPQPVTVCRAGRLWSLYAGSRQPLHAPCVPASESDARALGRAVDYARQAYEE